MVNSIVHPPMSQTRLRLVKEIHHQEKLMCTCYVPWKDQIYLGLITNYSYTLAVVEMKTSKYSTIPNIKRSITDMDLTDDGKFLFITTRSPHCYLLSVETRELVRSFVIGKNDWEKLLSFQFSVDCKGAYIFGKYSKFCHLNFMNAEVTDIRTETMLARSLGFFAISSNRKLLYGSNVNAIPGCLSLKKGLKYKTTKAMGNRYSSSSFNLLNQQNSLLFSTIGSICLAITDTHTCKLRQVKSFSCGVLFGNNITSLNNVPGYVIGILQNGHIFVIQDHHPFQVLSFWRHHLGLNGNRFTINVTNNDLLIWSDIKEPLKIFANDFDKLKSEEQDS